MNNLLLEVPDEENNYLWHSPDESHKLEFKAFVDAIESFFDNNFGDPNLEMNIVSFIDSYQMNFAENTKSFMKTKSKMFIDLHHYDTQLQRWVRT